VRGLPLLDSMTPFPDERESPSSGAPPTESHDNVLPVNGHGHTSRHAPCGGVYELVCIGFGPASLAIAIALRDASQHPCPSQNNGWLPKVCFLERQEEFRWHSGMLLPGSKMQISFLKDLATLRDPTSYFTFLNYLKQKDRLVPFCNLGTFLPTRIEFEDYLKWCASHFSDVVLYGQSVEGVRAVKNGSRSDKVEHFDVVSKDSSAGRLHTLRARHVVLAVGGRPSLPSFLPHDNPRILHSSQYRSTIGKILPSTDASYKIVVLGGGQSAAEIFHDLHTRYPKAMTTLVIRDTVLRPSDDSPFVNEVFDPDRVDSFYQAPESLRSKSLDADRGTNYGVVRLELLEQIYHDLYLQRITEPDEAKQQHRILPSRQVAQIEESTTGDCVKVYLRATIPGPPPTTSVINAHAVIAATGYTRHAHEEMLEDVRNAGLLRDGKWHVNRDYRLALDPAKVSDAAGIWLQGSNESTHGISDTLLSVLATRSGEMVQSIFGSRLCATTDAEA
jgi:L-ornithine N5-monooxygenase